MKLSVLLFAGVAERIGQSNIELNIDHAATVNELKEYLAEAYPEASTLIRSSLIAINMDYAPGHVVINEGDEVALIPPVSGGEDHTHSSDSIQQTHSSDDGLYSIGYAPLSIDETSAKVITANHGATLTFIGTTREMTGDQRTVHLEYEAYIPMALSTMKKIGDEIIGKWPGTRCAISHRLGKVDIAETSVVIAVSSPHRNDAYEASRYAIERLKQIVPIWKKEIWEDGSEWKGHQTGPWDPEK
ncbi:molybdopterin converting factor subunit 1 [Paenibacillus provencensis]|uniref:Molybdopterin converting factor subunit 1 n=1 Tax=Paenibacillus provencensis TaxID=441151 RepID=A0ABW3Q724_9BACL|nr:molybdopterin converting factor subunit 1 [Paenibacillus sp. MER 78]MCM3127324.1 molybdopterin converting factor subunit 1 [Paenibacillus sp. MER 78]